ncbi:tryptophan-rich sensory protein [bacterium]|nr:MAG: tryptophan-rich sensory protein [bacterium]
MPQNRNIWPKIISGVVVCEIAGAIAALMTASAVRDWYPTLMKPSWTPPSSLFGPVWMVLYAMMGAALGLIWANGQNPQREKRAVNWFWVQLALNVLWCAVFFGLRNPGWGYVVIITLWLAIAANLWLFSKISPTAAWLLVPYFLWVTFASTLNFSILSLNIIRPGMQKMDADPLNGKPYRKAPEFRNGMKHD